MLKRNIKMILNGLAYLLSTIIPKTNEIVIVGGWFGGRFADNSKAMYLFLTQNKTRLGIKKVIFITKNREIYVDLIKMGHIVLMYNSPKSIWYHLRSNIHIVDQGGADLNRLLSIRAAKINLWHGFALKRVNYMLEKGNKTLEEIIDLNYRKVDVGNWNEAFFLAQSHEQCNQLQWMFGLKKNQVLHGVYPRIVYMMGGIQKLYLTEEQNELNKIRGLKKENKKLIFYFPTFRDAKVYNDKCLDTIRELESFLQQNDVYLVTKLHYAASVKNHLILSEKIINLSSRSDVYNFLEFADILITDYSSIYFDYMLLKRPIIFYPFDLDYYQSSDRGLAYDYEDFTPGAKTMNINELKETLQKVLIDEKAYMMRYKNQHNKLLMKIYEHTATIDMLDELVLTIQQKARRRGVVSTK